MAASRKLSGFSLLEMLVATAVLSLLVVLLANVLDAQLNLWKRATGKTQSFQEARAAYETMTRKISQATLNTYWDYQTNSAGLTGYLRQSDLQFVSGPAANLLSTPSLRTHGIFFIAPLGYSSQTAYERLSNLLNVCGFFIEFGSDAPERPAFLANRVPERFRFRLKEVLQPTESNSIYSTASWPSNGQAFDWFRTAASSSNNVATAAENVILLAVRPRASSEEAGANDLVDNQFFYNSKDSSRVATLNQLPPLVQVVMIAIDERSAARLASGGSAPNFGANLDWNTLFRDPTKFDDDLDKVEEELVKAGISYQVFDSLVPINGAKWSS